MLKINYRSPRNGRKVIDSILSHNSFRIEVSTGIEVPEGVQFITPRQFKGGHSNDRAKIHQELSSWESKMHEKYQLMIVKHGNSISKDTFKFWMRMTVSELRGDECINEEATLSFFVSKYKESMGSRLITRKSNGKQYSQVTVINVMRFVKIIDQFIIEYGDFDFGKYNMDTEHIIGKFNVISIYDEYFEKFKSFLINKKGYAESSINYYTVMLKGIIKDRCDAHGINISNRYLSKLKYKSQGDRSVVALSQSQFEWILNNEDTIRDDFKDKKWASQFLDYFIAGLLTAARISDLDKLTSNNLIYDNGTWMLSYVPTKTRNSSGVKVEIPLHEKLVKLFQSNAEKYNGKLLNYKRGSLKCLASPYAKLILKRYEIFHNTVHIRDRNGDIKSVPFWKAFKFHSTRASLITYLLSNGEQETVIKSISGHTLDSKSFKVYTDISNSMKVRAMQKLAIVGVG